MKQSTEIYCSQMPLAVYREVAAHLRQVVGVSVTLTPQEEGKFNYQQSQIASLCLEYEEQEEQVQQVQNILDYYARKHGAWQEKS
ncbi:hypothetical protein K4A83_06720 [Spirulina subsalsa FACHB-351]|uniref:Uncharacterized protein n=1 Tax=Spirulina subsalsa FACHB-351 TaxID=234711 RepID=A0ABT3L4D5_9CYAN|nr:hypothetical protein [Spirulina subsalsa]MCW6035964.1 hypothetical protein [Spirulina subsalsa FACHB-351]